MRAAAGVLTFLVIAAPSPLHAQEESPPPRIFFSTGAGFGSHFTPHASVSLSHRTGDYLLRGALGYGPDLDGYGPWGGPREVTEVSLLYGRRKEWSTVWVRAALGVGWVGGDQLEPVGPGEEPRTSATGMAAQAGIVWAPIPAFGVGLTGVGNLNEFRSLGAVTLGVHVGRVR